MCGAFDALLCVQMPGAAPHPAALAGSGPRPRESGCWTLAAVSAELHPVRPSLGFPAATSQSPTGNGNALRLSRQPLGAV